MWVVVVEQDQGPTLGLGSFTDEWVLDVDQVSLDHSLSLPTPLIHSSSHPLSIHSLTSHPLTFASL